MTAFTIDPWKPADSAAILRIRQSVQPPRDWDPTDETGLAQKMTQGEGFEPEGAFTARIGGEVAGFALAVCPAPTWDQAVSTAAQQAGSLDHRARSAEPACTQMGLLQAYTSRYWSSVLPSSRHGTCIGSDCLTRA